MRPQAAPMAARIASSWRRPSARTSNRFATLVQAIAINSPTPPSSTHRVLPISPTRTSLRGRKLGAISRSVKVLPFSPGFMGNFDGARSSIRATSAFA